MYSDPRIQVELSERLNDDAKLLATVPLDALMEAPAELRGEISLIEPSGVTRFRATITTATVRGEIVEIAARTAPWLEDAVLPALVVRAPYDEQLWNIARIGGLRPEHIRMPKAFEQVVELFLVVAPVRGLSARDDCTVANVLLTRKRSVVEQVLDFGPQDEDKERFLAAGCWAVIEVQEASLFDAETQGKAAIDGALDQLALDAHYSTLQVPGGAFRDFVRTDRFGDPQRDQLVVVKSRSGRAWYRDTIALLDVHPVRKDLPTVVTPQPGRFPSFDRAVAAWRRAARAPDRVSAAVAIWEALEFYARDRRTPDLFTKAKVSSVVKAAHQVRDLDPRQVRRVEVVLRQFLNQLPAAERLREALVADRIPHVDAEVSAVARLRRPRSKAQHGDVEEPDEKDVEFSLGFVNRILVYWAAALAAAAEEKIPQ